MANTKIKPGYQATRFDKVAMGVIHGGVMTIASNLVLGILMFLMIMFLAFLNAHFPNVLVLFDKFLSQVFESAFLPIIYWGQVVFVMLMAEREHDPDLKWYISGSTSLLMLIGYVHL